jgi:hypothetical protein
MRLDEARAFVGKTLDDQEQLSRGQQVIQEAQERRRYHEQRKENNVDDHYRNLLIYGITHTWVNATEPENIARALNRVAGFGFYAEKPETAAVLRGLRILRKHGLRYDLLSKWNNKV